MPTATRIVTLGAGAALLAVAGRRLLRRDADQLPKGVQEFPPRLVDKRHGASASAAPATDAADIATEHYLER